MTKRLDIIEKKVVVVQRVRISEDTLEILKLVCMVGMLPMVIAAPGLAKVFMPMMRKRSEKDRPKQRVQRNIDSLVRGGFVDVVEKDGRTYYMVNKKGQWQIELRKGADVLNSLEKRWDGLWRIVIFDVPVGEGEVVRRQLTRTISTYGFCLMQHSVWVYPYPCEDFIALIKSKYELDKYILYMTATYIEREAELMKIFKVTRQ